MGFDVGDGRGVYHINGLSGMAFALCAFTLWSICIRVGLGNTLGLVKGQILPRYYGALVVSLLAVFVCHLE